MQDDFVITFIGTSWQLYSSQSIKQLDILTHVKKNVFIWK